MKFYELPMGNIENKEIIEKQKTDNSGFDAARRRSRGGHLLFGTRQNRRVPHAGRAGRRLYRGGQSRVQP